MTPACGVPAGAMGTTASASCCWPSAPLAAAASAALLELALRDVRRGIEREWGWGMESVGVCVQAGELIGSGQQPPRIGGRAVQRIDIISRDGDRGMALCCTAAPAFLPFLLFGSSDTLN